MSGLDAVQNVGDLVDELRGIYRFYGSESVDAFVGLINGFCLARGISPEALWSAAPTFVSDFLPPSGSKMPWSELIERSCNSPRSQVPLFYAALDWHRDTCYSDAWMLACDADWRLEFEAEERRTSGDRTVLPAPSELALVRGRGEFWHIFYLSDVGERYFEATMRSEEKLRRWATSCLRLGDRQWHEAPAGKFNKPWRR